MVSLRQILIIQLKVILFKGIVSYSKEWPYPFIILAETNEAIMICVNFFKETI